MPVLTPDALRWLVCPICRLSLTLDDANIVSCTGCGRRYPVVDGIPVLLPARAS